MYARIFIAVLDEMPRLHQLQRLCRGSIVVNVIEKVTPSLEEFALCLEMEGDMIDIWKRDAPNQAKEAARKLFVHWLNGNGRKPISWKTLIQALNENDLPIIATQVEEILTGHSGEISQRKSLATRRYYNKIITHNLQCSCIHTQCCSTHMRAVALYTHVLTVLFMGYNIAIH
jgi:GH24 family phage-related lysozyme (muramidase)